MRPSSVPAPRLPSRFAIALAALGSVAALPSSIFAVTATWTGAGANANWTTAGNWSGSTPYLGSTVRDLVFGTAGAGGTNLLIDDWTDTGAITFSASAPGFTFNTAVNVSLGISGNVTNSATVQQVFVATGGSSSDTGAAISFYESASITGDVRLVVQGSSDSGSSGQAQLSFYTDSNAGSATISNGFSAAGYGGTTYFWNNASAGSATIINEAATVAGGSGGVLVFNDNATAGSSRITSGAASGISFYNYSSAGTALITLNNSADPGINGAVLWFLDNATAGSATIVANGGNGMTETKIWFLADSDGAGARIVLNDGAVLDASGHTANVILNIGSIEGSGSGSYVNMSSSRHVSVGSLNTDTTFAGTFDGNSSARFYKVGTGTLTLTANSSSAAAATISAGTLQIGNGGTTGSFSGNIENNARLVFNHSSAKTYSKVVSGTGTLTKLGAGTLTLSGANTYTGATIITGGSLKLSSTGSIANTSSIHVASGATFDVSSVSAGVTFTSGKTLSGSGVVAGRVIMGDGAHLAPGSSPGTITFTNGLALNAGSILDFELGSSSDLIRVSGGTLAGPSSGTITVNISDAGGFAAGVYTLINATGASLSSIGATTFELGSSVAGYTYAFSQQGSTFLLTATAIPEPSTFAALAGLGVLGLAATRRRQRQA